MESIKIKGMSCQHCVGSVTKALQGIEGISQVSVDLDNGKATFENDGASQDDIKAAITGIGFEVLD
ncbi:heavy-metal-associated domain-containing protein [Desulforhopalus singaporensis]|uniref:Copper chaperone n=1 Tax=Desulforhopalus singaporensis TaxID=91360 RepID=A0A1H0J0Z3_9BACT|nr:heavy metal-associated domain-containing protein [Desulforhopalus singaporensis]SDO37448.1 copper chaperone [Desulforhopalus singaporensis]